MSTYEKEYDCEKLLLDCGLSTSRSKQLSPSLRAAIKRQDNEMNKTCNCKEVVSTSVKTEKPIKKKDVNEVLDSRKDNKEEK